MRTQARGLARAVVGETAARNAVLERTAPGGLAWSHPGAHLAPPPPDFAPPWPDVLVSCGRRSVALARALRRASGAAILAVHIQDPRVSPRAFDLVVAMDHDRIAAGPGVMKVGTALHDLTPAALAEAREAWRGRFERLGRPLVGVAVGGSIRGGAFTEVEARRLIAGLQQLRRETGVGLAITPSRRTSPAIRALLAEAFEGDPCALLWDGTGENPYRGILALADRLVVTSDSVSMVSEALATGRPVDILDLGFSRHAAFVEGLVRRGAARRFEGDPRAFRPVLARDATAEAAAAVRGLLQARAERLGGATGVVGKAS